MDLRVAAFGLALLLTLSGCAGNSKDPDQEGTESSGSSSGSGSLSASGTGTATSSSSATGTGGPANTPPTIRSFTGNSTGLDARFAFNATDAESSNLTFTLAFGDGAANVTGTVAGLGNATHAYAAAGAYNATLSVSDGSLSSNQTIKIEVVVTGPGNAAQHEEADDLVAAQACQGFFFPDLDGIAQLGFNVDDATIGLPYTATVDGDGIVGIRLGFFDSGGANKGGTALVPGTNTFSGTVPDGAVTAAVVGCGAGPYTAVYDAGSV